MPNIDSGQPGHPLSLIRVVAVHLMGVAVDFLSFLHADSEDSDQTGQIYIHAQADI